MFGIGQPSPPHGAAADPRCVGMKYGKYLEANLRPEWRSQYVDYGALKELIKETVRATQEDDLRPHSPRTTSLTVARCHNYDSLHEKFFLLLNSEVGSVNDGLWGVLQQRWDPVSQRPFHPLVSSACGSGRRPEDYRKAS